MEFIQLVISGVAQGCIYGLIALGFVLLVSMLVTPVMHHAPAVIIMGPISAQLAKSLGYNPDPFVMAVALGAASLALTACSSDPNSIAEQAKRGDQKGYVSGDGSIERIAAGERKGPVTLSGSTIDGGTWSMPDAPNTASVRVSEPTSSRRPMLTAVCRA